MVSQAPPRPVYVYFASDDYLTQHPPPKDQTPEQAEWQRQFRAEILASGKHWSQFGSLHELRASALRDGFRVRDPDRRPTNLPYRSLGTLFKGRDAFLDDLRSRLARPRRPRRGHRRPLAVHGLGGVGKTRAAIEYAWRHADDYSALLFVSAPASASSAPTSPTWPACSARARRGCPWSSSSPRSSRWLDDHPGWLLIIDNVDTEEAAREVERLLASLRPATC